MLIWGRTMKFMFGGRVFKMDCMEGVSGPSVGLIVLQTQLVESNGLIQVKGTIAIHVFFSMLCN